MNAPILRPSLAEGSNGRAVRPRISVVIPAYNEGHRIEATLREADGYLAAQFETYELLLADDGSIDDTAERAHAFAATHPHVTVLSLPHAGKAAAVRAGMTRAAGDYVVFTDADLATPLHYLKTFVAEAERGADIVIGSREGSGARRIGEPWYRHLMGRAFNRLVQIVVLPGIEDTQCGFKLFRAAAAEDVLARALLYREPKRVAGPRVTAFDVELLAIAKWRGLSVVPISVVWTYGQQSKVNPIRDTLHNGLDIARVRVNAWRGRYR